MTTTNDGVNASRLFWGSCLALITTAFAFSVTREIQTDVQAEFILTNANLGLFGGVFFWGFVISQVIFSPLCDTIGMRPIVRGAFIGHISGALLMMFAQNFTMLWVGSLLAGLGAGLVEAGCNPLIVALYPNKKTEKLNIFHMWFPYGNLIAALLALGLSQLQVSWEMRLLLILIPGLGYGLMMFTAKFPQTEGVSAGVGVKDMLKACVSPMMLLMLGMMLLTASMELPPSSWIPPVLTAGGAVSGILVFAFVFGIMGTLRLLAGPVERFLRPTGILFWGAVLSTVGLYLFSQATTTFMLFATAAIWAAGIAYFWPTMLGYVSERNPKSGALGLGLMGAMGMMAVALVIPFMGNVSDSLGHETIPETEAVAVLQSVQETFPALSAVGPEAESINEAATLAGQTLDAYEAEGALPPVLTTQALRAIDKAKDFGSVRGSEAAAGAASVGAMINEADSTGGKRAFRNLSFFGIILIVVFGAMLLRDRSKGGYQQEHLVATEETAAA